MQQGLLLVRWFLGETGQDLVEYALILAFVALVVAGSLILFEGDLQDFYEMIVAGLPFDS